LYTVIFNIAGEVSKIFHLERVAAGQTLLEVALANSVPLNHECEGMSTCGTCHIHVHKGNGNLEPIANREIHCLKKVVNTDKWSRLACQCLLLPGKGRILINLPDHS
jgi:2Fe-2S ferredoxin